jgi:uncharacterized protein YbcV (DUF1398 family)
MFTIAQIEEAHARVQSGADFPRYIQHIKQLGVTSFETWVADSHTNYVGDNDFSIRSAPQYAALPIADASNRASFVQRLQAHQRGHTNYLQFCEDCATTGVEKWIADLQTMTCTYYNKAGQALLVEPIPG